MDVTVTPRVEVERDPLGNETQGRAHRHRHGHVPDVQAVGPRLGRRRAVWSRTWDVTVITVVSIWKLATGTIPASNIGGPLQISMVAGQQAQQGVVSYAFFVALISVNLAILNLLPVPMLDGGHLLFFAIEAVLGRPLSVRKREIAQQIGLALLLLLMVFALFNDLTRLLPAGREDVPVGRWASSRGTSSSARPAARAPRRATRRRTSSCCGPRSRRPASTREIRINKSGCFSQCGNGPMIIVYPEDVWYAGVQAEDLPEIVQSHLLGGKPVDRLALPSRQVRPERHRQGVALTPRGGRGRRVPGRGS